MGQVVRSVRSLVTEAAVAMVSPLDVSNAAEFAKHKLVLINRLVENKADRKMFIACYSDSS